MTVKTKLSDLDYKILRALKDDSRKATSDIAEEVGVSAKTVSHRLAYMTKNFLVQFSIDWYPDASNDIMSIFHINLKSDANPNSVNQILQNHYPIHSSTGALATSQTVTSSWFGPQQAKN